MSEYQQRLYDVVKKDAYVDPYAVPVIKDPTKVPLIESSVQFTPFSKTSKKHGRSMHDPEGVIFNNVPVTDEFGDVYTDFSIKGADCSLLNVSYNRIEANNVRVHGMLDASTFRRCQTVSRILREAGVLTEWPILHMRPKYFPDDDVNLNVFKNWLYTNYVREQIGYRSKPDLAQNADSIGTAGIVGEGISAMNFSVMYRAMLSHVRLWEVDEHMQSGELNRHVAAAISSLQLRKPTHFSIWNELEALDANSPKDQQHYLIHILPSAMGENLARFHNTNSFHKYLHEGNWTLAGEIVDLDSVRSIVVDPDDGQEITVPARLNEVFSQVLSILEIAKITGMYEPDITQQEKDEYTSNNTEVMWDKFRESYFAERFIADDISVAESMILDSHFVPPETTIENIGYPKLVTLDDPEIREGLQRMMNALPVGFTSADLREGMMGSIESVVEQRVTDLLLSEGLNPNSLPGGIGLKRIIKDEVVRFALYLSKSMEIQGL